MSRKVIILLVALIGFAASFGGAMSGVAAADDHTGTRGSGDTIVLRSMDVSSIIDNSYAITEVTLVFENTGNDTGEVAFGLSLPEKAFISNFTLTIGNRTYHADVLRKADAQQLYDDAVANGTTAGLGQQVNTKRFAFSVNLQGNETVTASLRYEEFVPKFLGVRTHTIHLSSMDMRPEILDLSVGIHSMTGITGLKQVDAAYLLTESWDTSNHVTLALHQDDPTLSHDLALSFTDQEYPMNGTLQGYYDQAADEYYFLNIFSPLRSTTGDGFSKDIIFVLDKSGSMGGDKIAQLKQSFNHILDQLPENDRFNIIMFDSNIKTYKTGLIDATDSNKKDAKSYLSGQSADGSTNLYDGLEQALSMLSYHESRVPIIVMLTDGQANHGSFTSPVPIRENILKQNDIKCPIFCLGFGNDVNFEFLSALSLENNARAQKIQLGEDATEQIVNFYWTISSTLLKDLTVGYGDRGFDFFPEKIPALYEGSEAIIVGKYQIDNEHKDITSTITARTPDGTKSFVQSYPISYTDTDHESVKRFWVYARIYDILDHMPLMSSTEKDQAITEIEALAIDAHFVTPYTSLFLEIENETTGQGDGNDDGGTDSEADSANSYSTYGSTNTANAPPQPYGGGSSGTKMSGGSNAADAYRDSSEDSDAFLTLLNVPITITFIGMVLGIQRVVRKRRSPQDPESRPDLKE